MVPFEIREFNYLWRELLARVIEISRGRQRKRETYAGMRGGGMELWLEGRALEGPGGAGAERMPEGVATGVVGLPAW